MLKKEFFPTAMLMLMLAAMPWTQLITFAEGFPKKTHVASFTPHSPILITSNADFTAMNGVTGGSGTAKDPFLIECWDLDGDGYDCIHIKDTNAFFVIKNVWVHNGQFGIMLENLTNGIINNCTITDNASAGIRIWLSSNNKITGNKLFSNTFYGITIEESSDNTVSGNKLSSSRWGIIMNASLNNTVTGNNASFNENYGILLYQSSNNNISGNNLTANGFERASGSGMMLHYSNENIVYGNNISSNKQGFYISQSANNTISCNHVLNNEYGIIPYHGSENIFSGNNASSNKYGLYLYETSNNTILYNNAFNNEFGITLNRSPNNLLYHNNFAHNGHPASDNSANLWDNGYPSGGNYWSNYMGVDVDGDGVGDTPYIINAKNQDRSPLMGPFSVFEAGTWDEVTYSVEVVSNSTVSDFDFSPDNKVISFNVTGPNRTVGFCRVTIPNTFLGGPYDVLVNGIPPLALNEQSSGNNTFIHFTYNQSTKKVEIGGTTTIIPKSPSVIIPHYTLIVIILFSVISIIVLLIAAISKRWKSAR